MDRGLIGLDDSVFDVLLEVAALEVIGSDDGRKTLRYTKANKPITIRQLVTHPNGLCYDALSPLIMAYRAQKGQ